MRVKLLTICLILFLLMTGIVNAQSDTLPTYAAVVDGNVFIYNGSETIQVTDREDPTYGLISDLQWSPDGRYLLYIYNDGSQRMLMMTDASGSEPVMLTETVSYFGFTFALDGVNVIYAIEGDFDEITTGEDGRPQVLVRVYSRGLLDRMASVQVGEFIVDTGCGGGSPFPMDEIYNEDAGYNGNGQAFTMTAFGLLHSTSCSGVGLALLNLETGEDRHLGDFGRASLSPDGTQIAAVAYEPDRPQSNGMITIDLASGDVTILENITAVDQLTWANDGCIYFSIRVLADEPLPISAEDSVPFIQVTGLAITDVPQYGYEVVRYDLASGEVTFLNTGSGWAVGRLFSTDTDLYYTVIPNGEAWVRGIATGEINPLVVDSLFTIRASVAPVLYRIPLVDGDREQVGVGLGWFALQPGG